MNNFIPFQRIAAISALRLASRTDRLHHSFWLDADKGNTDRPNSGRTGTASSGAGAGASGCVGIRVGDLANSTSRTSATTAAAANSRSNTTANPRGNATTGVATEVLDEETT